MNDDDFDYYTQNVVPSQTEKIPPKKKKYDLMEDLAKIPKSSLKKNTGAVKTKNGYQQGVEITPMDMQTAREKAGLN
jgi:CxxC motif-containing protein